MQASWNQWSGAVSSNVGNYAANYPAAVPPAVGSFPSMPSSNPFPMTAASTLNSPVASTAMPSQYPLGNAMYGQHTQQQQWQQWEQWQQQYAQWHQQYGDKYQGPVPTPGIVPSNSSFSSVPPLPPGAPTVQPPPPDSVPPPPDKSGDSNKRSMPDSGGKDETKKLKLGKSSKSENLEDLIEQEKTFDGQFKSWEASFLKWKEQNANHPDKAQYKEYEAKWESWREQLLQKREQLRKKRENKEAEVAAAAAAAKEAALATSNVSTLQQQSYNSTIVNPSNPYANIYSMPGVYPSQDMLSSQSAGNYVSNFSMYNMPPPPNVPQMPGMPSVGHDTQNIPKVIDGSKSTQSLEFLSSTSANVKSIPGLDLAYVGSADKSAAVSAPFASNIPPNSSLFSYSQDVTKPLHTSDDKPFNFPTPHSQSQFGGNDISGPPQRQYGRGRAVAVTGNPQQDQFSRGSRFSRFDSGPSQRGGGGSNQIERNASFDDHFGGGGGGNFNRDADSRFNNDYKFSGGGGRNSDYRDEPPDKGSNRFGGGAQFTPNFSSDKFAKYLEDEYDDSRFRDPEPQNENQQYNNKSNYPNRDNNFGNAGGGGYNNRQQNFGGGRVDNSFGFNDRGRGNFERNRPGQFDRNKPDDRFNSCGRGRGNFGRGMQDNVKEGFGRGDFGRGANDSKPAEPSKPVSLLDLPPMKPPDVFDSDMMKLSEDSDVPAQLEENFNSVPPKNDRFFCSRNEPDENFCSEEEPVAAKPPFHPGRTQFAYSRSEPDQNFYSDKDSVAPALAAKKTFISGKPHELPPNPPTAKDPTPPPEVILNYVPSKIFEYDHISRNNDGIVGIFEPVYVFDYSHGKKKVNDSIHETEPLVVDFSQQNKIDDLSWDGGSWDEMEKRDVITMPLPPRNRTSLSDALKLNLMKSASEKSNDSSNFLNGTSKNNDISPQFDRKSEEKRWNNNAVKDDDMFAEDFEEKHAVKLVDEILCPPGRLSRPVKIVLIMRGPPGSGKTYLAKLIKDKEMEMGGSAPRILSLDDYFTIENDVETTDPATGKTISKKEMQYEYDAALESSYRDSLLKSFKKTVSDGFFPFIIVDCINDKVKNYEEMYNFAKLKGFQVYICEMERDIAVCRKHNIHNRPENEISKIISDWEKTPYSQTLLDVRSLLQSEAVPEVDLTGSPEESTDDSQNTQNSVQNPDEESKGGASDEDNKPENEVEEKGVKETSAENETNSTASAKSEPAPVSTSGFGYPRRARATFRGIPPRMPRPPGMGMGMGMRMPPFQERRGFGGPIWRRGWPSRR